MKPIQMTPEQKVAQIAKLKKLAMENYNNGGDAMVECWDDAQWEKFVDDCDRYWRPYDVCLYEIMGVLKEQFEEIESTIF